MTYDTFGKTQTVAIPEFEKVWNGITLVAMPDAASKEPDYGAHRLTESKPTVGLCSCCGSPGGEKESLKIFRKMKTIPVPDLQSATILKAAEMNLIHFAGNSTPLTAKEISEIARGE